MTIVRAPRPDDSFLLLRNEVIHDYRLSARALGILTRILARPDNWETSAEQLAKENEEGRDAIATALRQLREVGYMRQEKVQGIDGRWSTTTYVYDTADAESVKPLVAPKTGSQRSVFQGSDNRGSVSQGVRETTVSNNQKTFLSPPDGADADELKKPSKDAPGMRPEVDQLCDLLADRIEKNTGERPRITNDWRRQCRLMLDVDGRTVEKIAKCIEWCQADPFWHQNILSMPKLRKQYTQLQLRALAEQNKVATVHHLRPEPKPAAPTEGQTVTDPAAYAW
jgi:predicted transcriptional regulator